MNDYRVIVAPAAALQISLIAEWWAQNRSAARELFLAELGTATKLLAIAPRVGAVYARAPASGTRRLLIGRSKCHVYWEVDEGKRTVAIPAVWHAERGAGPPL